MSLSPSTSPSASSESESYNDFETEEHTVLRGIHSLPYDEELEPLPTEEEANDHDATIEQQQEVEPHYQQRYTGEVPVIPLYSGYISSFNRLCIHTSRCWRQSLVKWTSDGSFICFTLHVHTKCIFSRYVISGMHASL